MTLSASRVDFDDCTWPSKNAQEATSLRSEVQALRGEVRRTVGYDSVVSVSPKMTELMNFVKKVAASAATTILIQGESGTGKDLIAKAIHYESTRHEKPFVAINCSAIPETLMEAELFGHEKGAFTDAKQMKKGLFEAADGGTLFLDEIGEISPLLQAKLLRVLEDQVVRRVGGLRDIPGGCARDRRVQPRSRKGRTRRAHSARISTTGWPLSPFSFRPCAIARKTFFPWSTSSSIATIAASANPFADSPTRRALSSSAITGQAMCVSCGNTIERGMILEDEPFSAPSVFAVSVGESGGRTLFERTSPADGEDARCRTAAPSRGSTSPRAERRWKK